MELLIKRDALISETLD